MIYIEGKLIDKTFDLAWDNTNLYFEFELPNGNKIQKCERANVWVPYAKKIYTEKAWLKFDEVKNKEIDVIRFEEDLILDKSKEEQKALKKSIKHKTSKVNRLSNSNILDDEDDENYLDYDEYCYIDDEEDDYPYCEDGIYPDYCEKESNLTDEELDALEERYFKNRK